MKAHPITKSFRNADFSAEEKILEINLFNNNFPHNPVIIGFYK